MLNKDASATKVPVTAGFCALFTGQNISTTFFKDSFSSSRYISPPSWLHAELQCWEAKQGGWGPACPDPTGSDASSAPWGWDYPGALVHSGVPRRGAPRRSLCTGCEVGPSLWPRTAGLYK